MATEEKTADEPRSRFEIRLPKPTEDDREQDEEFCEVTIDGESRRFRFHDYHELYDVPGLYEQLFYEELECSSPRVLSEMIADSLGKVGLEADELRVLDVGAGNGIVGEELSKLGAESVVGVDIIDEAAAAQERDRPGVYDDYHVVDLTAIPSGVDEGLSARHFNCLTTVAALGFDDMPPEAFAGGYQYLADGGLVAITIKVDFITGSDDESGFDRMINAAIDDGTLEVLAKRRYTHRLSAAGEPIQYIAIVAKKCGELATAKSA